MALTTGSNTFLCTLGQAQFVAECANLRHVVTQRRTLVNGTRREFGKYELWWDQQTWGGGCRICFKAIHNNGDKGIVWISRHSGYAYADITEDVAQLFREIGCYEYAQGWDAPIERPHL